jgi:hypothetical protein
LVGNMAADAVESALLKLV